MLILVHIIIALSSVFCAAYALVAPSRAKLRVSYGLVAATLASGTYLVWSSHSPLMQSCTTGLVYLSIVFSLIAISHRRLANENTKD